MATETSPTTSAATTPAPNPLLQHRRTPWIVRQYRNYERLILGALTIVLVLGAWQLSANQGWVKVTFTSSPSRIWDSAKLYFFNGGTGWKDVRASGKEFAYGFLISVAIGVPLGILMGWYHRLDALVNPLVLFLNNSPRLAYAPLFVIWFGLGLESKIWVVVTVALVPIIMNARAGVVTIEPALLAMSRSYGSSDLRVLRTVVLPGTVPSIASGLRLGVGWALGGVVLAEFIASTQGLGFTVVNSAANFNTDRLFVAVFAITIIGMLATALVGRIEKYFERWRTG